MKSVERYWSPNACRPITIGFVHPGTGFGIFSRMMGSRNTVPPRIFRIYPSAHHPHFEAVSGRGRTVPLGLLHISFNLNSSTRASSGVMVAHLTPTEYFLIASAESIVTWSFVWHQLDTSRRGKGGSLQHHGIPFLDHSIWGQCRDKEWWTVISIIIPRFSRICGRRRNWHTSSLIFFQMILVISSPSISTTGFLTIYQRRLSLAWYTSPLVQSVNVPLILSPPAGVA